MAYAFRHGDQPLEGITIQRAVGRGGFGEVYYAVTDSGKDIALKFLRENAEIELRGVGEVINLSNPHLVNILDVRRNDAGEPFVLMEYISGPSLHDVLRAEPGGLAPEKAVFLARGIAAGLTHLHDHGVVHRDLKPANIFYDASFVKIGDYGLSKHMTLSQHSGQTVSIGTVHYMAPEIGSGRYTKLVDIYALGVILYEMLAGRLPFVGASIQEVLIRQFRDEPELSAVPPAFRAIIAQALAKEPEARFQSAEALADALEQVSGMPERLSRFDPLTLTQVPRGQPVDDVAGAVPTRTATPGVPALDVRQSLRDERGRRPYEVPPPYADRYRRPNADAFMMPLGIAVFCNVFGVLFAVASGVGVAPVTGAQLQKLAFVVGIIPSAVLLYRWWATLPSGWRRTTPGRAVGFCFIPVFNFYWFWVALHGLVIDLNRYRKMFAADLEPLSHLWLIAFWILLIASSSLGDALVDKQAAGVGPFYFVTLLGWTIVDIVFKTRTTILCRHLIRREIGARPEALGVTPPHGPPARLSIEANK